MPTPTRQTTFGSTFIIFDLEPANPFSWQVWKTKTGGRELAMQMQQAEEEKDKDIYAGIFSMLSDFSASVETESEKLNCMMLALLGEPCLP